MYEPRPPFEYRPNQLDDWGEIRDSEGRHVVRVTANLATPIERALARHHDTDPLESVGRRIAEAMNRYWSPECQPKETDRG